MMSQITIIAILQKIRVIAKECSLQPLPSSATTSLQLLTPEIYLAALQKIRTQFIKLRNLQQEYSKLEGLLQLQEMQLRKRVSVQQQLKLYTETLKVQVEELEKQKIELLQNSKNYIKELKKTNQSLFSKLTLFTEKKANHKSKSKEESPPKTQKSKNNKSLSRYKSKQDKSLRQIIKTEYIQRDLSNSTNKKKNKKVHKFGGYSTLNCNKQMPETSKTFQLGAAEITAKQLKVGSHKKDKHVFSNLTLLNILETSNKKFKHNLEKASAVVSRSPAKKQRAKQVNNSRLKIESRLGKQKKANKSIFSVSSVQGGLNNKKQTI